MPPHDFSSVSVEKGQQENKGFDFSTEAINESDLDRKLRSNNEKLNNRPKWGNQLEFLMSCIATSVGLGNVWRFPFVAYQNGGGAFLIPYIILLIIVGKPMYFLELVIGQFSNRNIVKVWAMCPAVKGVGYAQALAGTYILSYLVSIVTLCLYYFAMSFSSTLPWALCDESWENCVPSGQSVNNSELQGNYTSSAEYYFKEVVLRQPKSIHDGIGLPLWDLTLCLLASWIIIFVIVARGIKSTGKASYVLALFPYVVMFILLIRAVTLPGAVKGILFFVTPDWYKILEVKVWYAAVTQVFFSLSVCSGALVMFASYNNFDQNVYRDAMIVTTLDTFTSLLSGITIFAILGNLAYELNYDDVGQVIGSGGSSLAFISYPDAIAKSPAVPQLFAVLFFLMMAILGIGSAVALISTIGTILLDALPSVSTLVMSASICVITFFISLVYVTPGGQYILEIVDYYGGTFLRLFSAIFETIGIIWIYGLENLTVDIQFMLGRTSSFYWRICWGVIVPVVMIMVFFYAMIGQEKILFGGTYEYPPQAYIAGNCLQYVGIALIPLFIILALWKYRSNSIVETVKAAFRKKPTYGPVDIQKRKDWIEFRENAKLNREMKRRNWFYHILIVLFRGYQR